MRTANTTSASTAALAAVYLMENRSTLSMEAISTMIDFASWARIRDEDEFVAPASLADDEFVEDANGREHDVHGQFVAEAGAGSSADDRERERMQTSFAGTSADTAATGLKTRHTAKEIEASITPEYLVSFEDGRKYKTLTRHLHSLGMTREDYKAKHGLPADYPTVAANFSKQRSEIARSRGVGRTSERRRGAQPGNQNGSGNRRPS